MQHFSGDCPVCGGSEFSEVKVLGSELVSAWQLSDVEKSYIDRQQGFHCLTCRNNFRAMALAAAILSEYGVNGPLEQFSERSNNQKILEINTAANLAPYLSRIPGHRLVEYPQYDMQSLDFESASFDLVIHSDTLEHIPDPQRGLEECRRILKPGGRCIFTIPLIVDRLTRSRIGLPPSYHGPAGTAFPDQVVCSEFGMDVWKIALLAGFSSVAFFSLEYPSALAIIARKY